MIFVENFFVREAARLVSFIGSYSLVVAAAATASAVGWKKVQLAERQERKEHTEPFSNSRFTVLSCLDGTAHLKASFQKRACSSVLSPVILSENLFFAISSLNPLQRGGRHPISSGSHDEVGETIDIVSRSIKQPNQW